MQHAARAGQSHCGTGTRLRTARFVSDDVVVASNLDRALEFCEQNIIDVHRTAADDERSLRAWWSDAFGQRANADRLAEHCRRLKYRPAESLPGKANRPVSMHFILEGRIGIVVNVGDARTMRVRSLGPHTTIGEMGLITGRPRSATIAAEADSVLYELKAEDYERIN